MSSKKCLSCGIVNFADAETCKKCGAGLIDQTLSTACPRCKSENTQSYQMAYQTGTSTGIMVGVTGGGQIGAGGGKSQSNLAKSIQPPKEASVSDSLFYIVVAILAFNAVGGALMIFLNPFVGFFTAVILTVAFGIFAVIRSRGAKEENQRRFQAAMKRWSRSWICLKCGGTWLVHQ